MTKEDYKKLEEKENNRTLCLAGLVTLAGIIALIIIIVTAKRTSTVFPMCVKSDEICSVK